MSPYNQFIDVLVEAGLPEAARHQIYRIGWYGGWSRVQYYVLKEGTNERILNHEGHPVKATVLLAIKAE